jgi:hypothetical protein
VGIKPARAAASRWFQHRLDAFVLVQKEGADSQLALADPKILLHPIPGSIQGEHLLISEAGVIGDTLISREIWGVATAVIISDVQTFELNLDLGEGSDAIYRFLA